MESQAEKLDHENARLKLHLRECEGEVKRINESTVKLESEVNS